jgi:hypothetical protein
MHVAVLRCKAKKKEVLIDMMPKSLTRWPRAFDDELCKLSQTNISNRDKTLAIPYVLCYNIFCRIIVWK